MCTCVLNVHIRACVYGWSVCVAEESVESIYAYARVFRFHVPSERVHVGFFLRLPFPHRQFTLFDVMYCQPRFK